MASAQYITSTKEKLFAFAQACFLKVGFSKDKAKLTTQNLIEADLRGIDSHGIARLTGYIRLVNTGRCNPDATHSLERDKLSATLINANSNLGLSIGNLAMEIAVEKAQKTGIAITGVYNSNHFGIAGQYAEIASRKGCIGIVSTNASPLVVAPDGLDRFLGTNPIAFSAPTLNLDEPFLADFATTTAANGKLEILERNQQPTPAPWLQTKEGEISFQADELKRGGALLPLGSTADYGVHKGFCLGAMVDILTGVLTGANYGPFVPPFVSFLPLLQNTPGEGIGHFFIAIDPKAFLEDGEFETRMSHWIEVFKASKTKSGRAPILPGEPERANKTQRLAKGVPVHYSVANQLQTLAAELDIEFNLEA